MRTFLVFCASSLALTALADYLLFGHPLGCGVTVFAGVLAAVLCARYGRKLFKGLPWLAVWAVIAIGASRQSSVIGILVLVALTWGVLAMARSSRTHDIFDSICGGAAGAVRGFFAMIGDMTRKVLWKDVDRIPYALAWVVGLPAVIVVIFAAIVIPANLVLADWMRHFISDVVDWITHINAMRVIFWIVVCLEAYCLLRIRPRWFRTRLKAASGGPAIMPPPLPPGVMVIADPITSEMKKHYEFLGAMVTFVGLNVVFLAANATDAAYLWFSLKLPLGLSYSEYAQQGAYRLIVAVVLAAVTITAFFRTGARQSESRGARFVAYFFILQNAIVLIGAARRLELYVTAYGLTRLRVAAFVWMVLVLAGFVTILWKLIAKKPFHFLLWANTVTVMLALSAVSVMNIDGFIADWNVARYEEGKHKKIDVGYLGHLGEPAMPALVVLAKVKDREVSRQAGECLNVLIEEARDRDGHWQSRTIRNRMALEKAIEEADKRGIEYAH